MLPRSCCHRAALNVATQLLPPNCCHPIVATEPHQMLPPKCCQPNVASHDATTTTRRRRRRRDDAEAATARASRCSPQVPAQSLQVQVPSQSLQPPKRLHSRCSLCGHSLQALPVSRAPCSPSSRSCIPPRLYPHLYPHRPAHTTSAGRRALVVIPRPLPLSSPLSSPILLDQERRGAVRPVRLQRL